jgi:formylglycine-generating enzyme required for sulfatase activity
MIFHFRIWRARSVSFSIIVTGLLIVLSLACGKKLASPLDNNPYDPDKPVNPPTYVTAAAMGTNKILLTWLDNSHNEDGFCVERGETTGAGDSVYYTGPNATSCIDSNLRATTIYHYVVVARARERAPAASEFSGEAICTTWTAPAALPAGMKHIPGGAFRMGSAEGGYDERPVHAVIVSSFYMDATEVTQADYQALMGFNPSGFTGNVSMPVENLTWFDAVLYCNQRSKVNSRDTVYSYTAVSGTPGNGCSYLSSVSIDYSKPGYRLPTEAEAEYACRGLTHTDGYWGNESALDYAWYSYNSDSTTKVVAGKLPNYFGLFDMSGNVSEWCNDWFDGYYYGSSPVRDPQGPSSGTERARRGGSWGSSWYGIISSYRHYSRPSDRGAFIGFRCVLNE